MYLRVLSTLKCPRWLAAGLWAGALGCTDAGPTEPASTLGEPIVRGERSGAEQDGVVLLRAELEDKSELLCSASLVGPNLILTARHCVAYLSDGQFSCTVRGEPVDNPTGGGRLGLHLPAESLEIYGRETPRKTILAHGQQIISTLSPTICNNDLAFVVLDTSLELPLVPMRLGRPAQAHEAAVLVGYGLDGEQELLDYRTQLRAQKRDLEIEAVGPDSVADGVTTVPPRAVILDGPSGCVGDSGGPLLAQETGAILGVYSLQQGDSCTAPDVRHRMTHVPPFQALIDEAFTAAGCEPLPEDEVGSGSAGAPPSAGGATETGGAAEANEAGDAAGGASTSAGTDTGSSAAAPSHRSSCAFAPTNYDDATGPTALLALAGLVVERRRRAAARR
ncbi:MAG: trypsin-like serine protease [Myxococcales bacterium]